jgi:hypothetical protein
MASSLRLSGKVHGVRSLYIGTESETKKADFKKGSDNRLVAQTPAGLASTAQHCKFAQSSAATALFQSFANALDLLPEKKRPSYRYNALRTQKKLLTCFATPELVGHIEGNLALTKFYNDAVNRRDPLVNKIVAAKCVVARRAKELSTKKNEENGSAGSGRTAASWVSVIDHGIANKPSTRKRSSVSPNTQSPQRRP